MNLVLLVDRAVFVADAPWEGARATYGAICGKAWGAVR